MTYIAGSRHLSKLCVRTFNVSYVWLSLIGENSEGSFCDPISDVSGDSQSAYPFTPVNSFSDSYSPSIPMDRHLPAFNSREVFHKIIEKDVPIESSLDPSGKFIYFIFSFPLLTLTMARL